MNTCCGCTCVMTPEPPGGVWYPAGGNVQQGGTCTGGCGCDCNCGGSSSEECGGNRFDGLVPGFLPADIISMTFNGVDVKSLSYGDKVIWDNSDSELSVSANSVSLKSDGAGVAVGVFSNTSWVVENPVF